MSDLSLDVDGLDVVDEQLRQAAEDLERPGEWLVGTAVEYSVYLEFGTRDRDPKPTFRPALREAQADLESFVARNTRTTVQAIDTAEELVETVALALERRIKQLIREKELIDTGAFRASVKAVRTTDQLQGLADVAARSDVNLDPEDFE